MARTLSLIAGIVATAALEAGTVLDADFRGVPEGLWRYAGQARLEASTGAVLVQKDRDGWGTLVCDLPFETRDLTVRLLFSVDAGAHGHGDGLAIAFLATPAPDVQGTGGGLFGLGNLAGCRSALVVEFDTTASDPADFGPIGAGLYHVGLAYAGDGAPPGTTFLTTFAARDLRALLSRDDTITVAAEISLHGNRVTVACAPEGEEPVRAIEAEIPQFIPFEGYLAFGAANGAAAGRVTVHAVAVDAGTLPAPKLRGSAGEVGVELWWDAEGGTYASFTISRDGEILGTLPGEQRSYADPAPAPGKHVYELRARGVDGSFAPPTGIELHAGSPFLIVDAGTPCEEPSLAARAWLERLAAAGRPAARATGIGELMLERFRAIVWVNGSGIAQRPLSRQESTKLARYASGSEVARLYLEGPDLWSAEDGDFADADGVRCAGDGWPGTDVEDRTGFSVDYHGATVSLDELEPAPEELDGEVTVLWRRFTDFEPDDSLAPATYGIAIRSPGDRLILVATSLELYRFALEDSRQEIFDQALALLETPRAGPRFRRGDVSEDGAVNIGDPIAILGYLFGRLPLPRCPDAADTNDDGSVQISDAISLLSYLFAHGPMPSPGAKACGADPTADALPACESTACPR